MPADDIKNAKDLHELLDALRAFQAALSPGEDCENALSAAGIELMNLPHYGGPHAPLKTFEVWSWDDDRVLVGTGPFTEWRIVDRADWEKGYVVTDHRGAPYFEGRGFETYEDALKAAKSIVEAERPWGVSVCLADVYSAQKDEEVYMPTLSTEAMTALDARDSALDYVAQAALDVWENYAEEGQVMDRRKLAEALHDALPCYTVETWEVFLKKFKPRTAEDRVKELEESLGRWSAILRGPGTPPKARPVWPASLSKTKH